MLKLIVALCSCMFVCWFLTTKFPSLGQHAFTALGVSVSYVFILFSVLLVVTVRIVHGKG